MSVEKPPKVVSLVGRKFGKLLVVSYSHRIKTRDYWTCLCECGKSHTVQKSHLTTGHTKSCGCASSRHTIGTRSKKHGKSHTTIYYVWANMRKRCSDPTYKEFHLYGGRGITVCEDWAESFASFYADMGDPPKGMELDRIDNNGPYAYWNCRWVTASRNCRNRRTTLMIKHMGETLSLSDWAERIGVKRVTLWRRIQVLGWSVEKSLTMPSDLPHYMHYQRK